MIWCDVGRGEGGVVWTGDCLNWTVIFGDFEGWAVICWANVGRVGRECCLDWTVVRPLPSVQRMNWTVIFGDLGDGL